MAFDIIRIVDEIKKFVNNENDTYLGLFFFMIAGLLATNFFIDEFLAEYTSYTVYVGIVVMSIIFVLWMANRRVPMSKEKITVGVAHFEVISLDVKNGVEGVQKVNLQEEVNDFIVDSLHGDRNRLHFDQQISVTKFPMRFKFNEYNIKQLAERLKVDIIIWGTIRYESSDVIHIEPNFHFFREPSGLFYSRFKNKVIDREIYALNLKDGMTQVNGVPLANLIHYLMYVALLFAGIKKMNHGLYEEAKGIFEGGLSKLTRVKNPNSVLHDIFLMYRFYEGKNYYAWGNYLLKKKHDREDALEEFGKAAEVFLSKDNIKGLTEDEELEFLRNSYLCGIHVLIKEGKYDEAKKKLQQIEKKLVNDPEVFKEEIEYLSHKSAKETKALIKKVLTKKDMKEKERLYSQIGHFFYHQHNYDLAEKYLEERLKLNPKDIYKPAFFDTEDHLLLLKSHVRNMELIKANKDLVELALNKSRNYFKKERGLV